MIRSELVFTCSVEIGPFDGPHFVVGPIHLIFHRIVVNGNGMLDLVQWQDHVRVIWHVQRDLTDVSSPSQQQQLFHAYEIELINMSDEMIECHIFIRQALPVLIKHRVPNESLFFLL